MHFVGERPGGLADTGTAIIEKLDPAVNQLVSTLKSLDLTAANVGKITDPEADLAKTFTEFRVLGRNLTEMTGPDGPIRQALAGIERLTREKGELSGAVADFRKLVGPDSSLSRALANAEKFTEQLANNSDIEATLKNFRSAATQLNATLGSLKGNLTSATKDLSTTAKNLSQGSDTVKRQPWRLIWPTTKKYPEDGGRVQQQQPKAEKERSPTQSRKRPLFRTSAGVSER
jgi:hypothetical protein